MMILFLWKIVLWLFFVSHVVVAHDGYFRSGRQKRYLSSTSCNPLSSDVIPGIDERALNCTGSVPSGTWCTYACKSPSHIFVGTNGSVGLALCNNSGIWQKDDGFCLFSLDRKFEWSWKEKLLMTITIASPFVLIVYAFYSELCCFCVNPCRKRCALWCFFPAPSIYAHKRPYICTCSGDKYYMIHLFVWGPILICALATLLLFTFHWKDAHEKNQWMYRTNLEVLGSYETLVSKNKERTKHFGIGSCINTRPHRTCHCITPSSEFRTDCYIAQYRVRWTCLSFETRGESRVCEDWYRDLHHMWTYAPDGPDTVALLDNVHNVSEVAQKHPIGSAVSGWVDCARKNGCTVRAMGGKGINWVIYVFMFIFAIPGALLCALDYFKWLYYECKTKNRHTMSKNMSLQARPFRQNQEIELASSGVGIMLDTIHSIFHITTGEVEHYFYEVPLSREVASDLRASISKMVQGHDTVSDAISELKNPLSLLKTRVCVIPELYWWDARTHLTQDEKMRLDGEFDGLWEELKKYDPDVCTDSYAREEDEEGWGEYDDKDDEDDGGGKYSGSAKEANISVDDEIASKITNNTFGEKTEKIDRARNRYRVALQHIRDAMSMAELGMPGVDAGYLCGKICEIDPLLLEDAFVEYSDDDDDEKDTEEEAKKIDDSDSDSHRKAIMRSESWDVLDWQKDATQGPSSHWVPAEFQTDSSGRNGKFLTDINGVYRNRDDDVYRAISRTVTSLLPHFERVSEQPLRSKIVPVIICSVTLDLKPGGIYVDAWSRIGPRGNMGGVAAAICVFDQSGELVGGDLQLSHSISDSKVTVPDKRLFRDGAGTCVVFASPDNTYWRFSNMTVSPSSEANGCRRFLQVVIFPASHRSRKLLHKLPLLTSRYRGVNKHRRYVFILVRWNVERGYRTAFPFIIHHVLKFLVNTMNRRWAIRQRVLRGIEENDSGPKFP